VGLNFFGRRPDYGRKNTRLRGVICRLLVCGGVFLFLSGTARYPTDSPASFQIHALLVSIPLACFLPEGNFALLPVI